MGLCTQPCQSDPPRPSPSTCSDPPAWPPPPALLPCSSVKEGTEIHFLEQHPELKEAAEEYREVRAEAVQAAQGERAVQRASAAAWHALLATHRFCCSPPPLEPPSVRAAIASFLLLSPPLPPLPSLQEVVAKMAAEKGEHQGEAHHSHARAELNAGEKVWG